jgi:hypothetical protein
MTTILAEPKGEQSLVHASFWQVTGYGPFIGIACQISSGHQTNTDTSQPSTSAVTASPSPGRSCTTAPGSSTKLTATGSSAF